jgi:hypothetical protein
MAAKVGKSRQALRNIAIFVGRACLTWLAYKFPEIGGSVFRLLQPSPQVAK